MHLFLSTPLGQDLPAAAAEVTLHALDLIGASRMLDALNRSSAEEAVERAFDIARAIASELKSRGVSPAKCQVLVSALAHRVGVLEDALREYGMRPVHLHGLTGTLVEPQGLRPAVRAPRLTAAPAVFLDLRQPEATLAAQLAAADEALGSATDEVSARRWAQSLVAAVTAAFEASSSAKQGRAVVLSTQRWLTSLAESSLEKAGVLVRYAGEAGAELIEGSNAISGEEIRGLNALRNALPEQGKGVTHEELRAFVPAPERCRLGALPKVAQAAQATEWSQRYLAQRVADAAKPPAKATKKAPSLTPVEPALRPSPVGAQEPPPQEEPPVPSPLPAPAAPAEALASPAASVLDGAAACAPELASAPSAEPAPAVAPALPDLATKESAPAARPSPRPAAVALHPLVKFLRSRRTPLELSAVQEALGAELFMQVEAQELDAAAIDACQAWLVERASSAGVARPDALDALFAWAHSRLTNAGDNTQLTNQGRAMGTLGELRARLAQATVS